jgi:hypothetical protein
MMRFSKKFLVATASTALALFAGVALASWVASGSGAGYTKAVTAKALTTVGATATTVAQLYPGGSGDVKIKILNPNPYPIRVTDITGNGTIVTIPTDATCDGSTGVTFTDQHGLSLAVPAANGPSGTLFTLSGAALMGNSTVDACQGKTFKIPVNLIGISNA